FEVTLSNINTILCPIIKIYNNCVDVDLPQVLLGLFLCWKGLVPLAARSHLPVDFSTGDTSSTIANK
uniref:hypothetical protein n=1 Tax=Salmonella sp. s51933 TaxID=3160127 RepID=UPI003754915F